MPRTVTEFIEDRNEKKRKQYEEKIENYDPEHPSGLHALFGEPTEPKYLDPDDYDEIPPLTYENYKAKLTTADRVIFQVTLAKRGDYYQTAWPTILEDALKDWYMEHTCGVGFSKRGRTRYLKFNFDSLAGVPGFEQFLQEHIGIWSQAALTFKESNGFTRYSSLIFDRKDVKPPRPEFPRGGTARTAEEKQKQLAAYHEYQQNPVTSERYFYKPYCVIIGDYGDTRDGFSVFKAAWDDPRIETDIRVDFEVEREPSSQEILEHHLSLRPAKPRVHRSFDISTEEVREKYPGLLDRVDKSFLDDYDYIPVS